MQPPPLDQRLAQLLVARGVLSPQRAHEALAAAGRHPGRLDGSTLAHLLVAHRVVTLEDGRRWVAAARGGPRAASDETTFAPGLAPASPPPAASNETTFAPGLAPASPPPAASNETT
ncbi:MAG: hypothetical protein KDD82_02775, partial [Planctomycetes bacterium]|nr:hypothetical protein [Planctomycetota bacterium]MCA8920703.1 hypothetical protein [Planctomycetota bacterium]